jgi:hypothetical protein
MTVPLHVAADDGSVEHVEGGEESPYGIQMLKFIH